MNRVEMNGRAMFGDCIFLSPPVFSQLGSLPQAHHGATLAGVRGSSRGPRQTPEGAGDGLSLGERSCWEPSASAPVTAPNELEPGPE